MNKYLLSILGILLSISHIEAYEGLGLSAHDIVQLSAVGVTPEYVQQIQKLGYKDISAHDITQLYAVGVKPDYVEEIRKLGYTNISIHDITQLHAVGVKSDYVKEIKKLGYKDISAHDITQLYTVGVKPDYMRQTKNLGYDDLSIHDITQFYVTGVTPDYIKKMKGSKIKSKTHKIHIPEIKMDVPDVQVHIPEIKVDVPHVQVRVSGVQHTRSNPSPWKNAAKIAGLSFLVLGIGFAVYKLKDQYPAPAEDPNIESRMTEFEKRVTDLQDILISIDDRLDRQRKQN